MLNYLCKFAVIVNTLKGLSSRKYGQAGFPKPYGKQALWSLSYFVAWSMG
jgi:putative transposase